MHAGQQAVRHGARVGRVPRLDYVLLMTAVALASLGLVMVASASITFADRDLGQPFYYALRQAVYIGIGVLLAMPVYRLRLALLEQAGLPPDLLNPTLVDELPRKNEAPRSLAKRLCQAKAEAAVHARRLAAHAVDVGEEVEVLLNA